MVSSQEPGGFEAGQVSEWEGPSVQRDQPKGANGWGRRNGGKMVISKACAEVSERTGGPERQAQLGGGEPKEGEWLTERVLSSRSGGDMVRAGPLERDGWSGGGKQRE